jgi:hypothetical protein
MKIEIPRVDGRSWQAQSKVFVRDADTDQQIGHIENRQGSTYIKDGEYWRHPSRHISLFSGKYTGTFETHEECLAFAKGVEAVVNHMVSGAYPPAEQKSA